MTEDNVTPIRRVSLTEQARVARKILRVAESTLRMAGTPKQLAVMEARVERIREKVTALERMAERAEGASSSDEGDE